MLIKEDLPEGGTVRVTFVFPGEIWAESVHLVGEFNDWDRESLPLRRPRQGDGNWEISLDLERGRSYEFRYLVNGETWVNDCNADDYVPNPYGGSNAVVRT